MNVLKLRGKIAEMGMTNAVFAEKAGIPYATFYRRLENNGVGFTIGEVNAMSKVLSLTNAEAMDIFLPLLSQK